MLQASYAQNVNLEMKKTFTHTRIWTAWLCAFGSCSYLWQYDARRDCLRVCVFCVERVNCVCVNCTRTARTRVNRYRAMTGFGLSIDLVQTTQSFYLFAFPSHIPYIKDSVCCWLWMRDWRVCQSIFWTYDSLNHSVAGTFNERKKYSDNTATQTNKKRTSENENWNDMKCNPSVG